MNRITKEQQDTIIKHPMTAMELAIYKNLLSFQERFPNLSKRQYRLFLSIFDRVTKKKKTLNYHG
jgi:hypothetical protein